jgi:hypothetical protein
MVGYFKDYLMHKKRYFWKRPFQKPIELYRCETDHLLLTDKLMAKGHCAGHHIRQPATPTILELVLIYLGIIR